MRTFVRTFGYTTLLFVVLGYGSYLVYRSPGQIQARIERELARYLTVVPRLDGCQQSFLSALRVRRIEVPARTPIVSRDVLSAESITLEDPLARRLFRFRRAEEPDAARPTIRIEKVQAALERSAAPSGGIGGPSAPAGSTPAAPLAGSQGNPGVSAEGAWSFEGVLRAEALPQLAESNVQFLAERVQIDVREVLPARDVLSGRLELTDAEATHLEGKGWSLEADLTGGASWAGGWVEMIWGQDGAISARGAVESARDVESWIPLLGPRAVEVWDLVRPRGVFDVDVQELRREPGGKFVLQAQTRHYDTTIRLGSSGLELHRLRGSIRLEGAELRFEEGTSGAAPSAELLGLTVYPKGVLSAAAGELTLRLPRAQLASVLADILDPGSGTESLFQELGLDGEVGGHAAALFRRGEPWQVTGTLDFDKVRLKSLPCLEDLRGTATFERTSGASAWASGRGRFLIEESLWSGIGGATGEVRFDWDETRTHVQLSNLKVIARRGEARPAGAKDAPVAAAAENGKPALPALTPAPAPEPAEGTGPPASVAPTLPAVAGPSEGGVIASLDWERAGGLRALDLRWLGLTLDTQLIRANNVSGNVQLAGGTGPAAGSMELGAPSIPAGLLWREAPALEFQSGKATIAVETGARTRILVRSLRLSGESRSLRAQGDFGVAGDIAFVVLLSEGPTRAALDRLPDSSTPADWREAARGSYRAFRLHGTIAKPTVSEIGPLDPVFVRRP